MSDKKLQSSRRNGALSRKNPLSPELSHKVAMNAVRHGLNSTTAIVVLANESEEIFNKLHESFIRRHQPADEAERDFVRQLAFARWRLRRITTLETALFDLEMDGQDIADTPERRLAIAFRSLACNTGEFQLLTRYESRIERCYTRALEQLEDLQANRTPVTPGESVDDAFATAISNTCINEPTPYCDEASLPPNEETLRGADGGFVEELHHGLG